MNKKYSKGFTLIEIMIVVAILGIVSSIAFPMYTDYVIRAKRADAKVELMKIAQLQESYFVENLSYAKDLTSTRASGGLDLGGTVMSEQNNYSIAVSNIVPANCTGLSSGTSCTGFTLTATALGAQTSDAQCLNFSLTSTGTRGVSTVTSASPSAAEIEQLKSCWK